MTIKINRDVYERDPSLNRLLNQGVAKVTSGVDEHELETLRYEITNFVCDGQYAKGLERILRSYLTEPGSIRTARRVGERFLRQRQKPPGQNASVPVERLRIPRRCPGTGPG